MAAIEWMNQLAEAWASVMWIRVLDSACVFLLIGTLWLIVRKWAPAQFGYYLFLLVLVKLILPAPVSVPGLVHYLFPGESTQESLVRMNWAFPFPLEGGGAAEANTVTSQESMAPAPSQTGPEISLLSIFMLLWGIGAFFFFLYHAIVEWKTCFMMRNTIPLEPNQLPVNVHELQRQAGIKRKVHWVTGYWVKSPVAYGLFHPKIAVPMEMARNYSERQIRWILLHELAHIKRGDTLVFLFQRLLQSLFFFNPLIWWVNALIDRLREYACDDAALVESQAPPKECGEGFLGVVMQNNGLPTFQYATHGLINYKTMIRRRLMRILDDKRRLHAKLKFGAGVFLLAITLFVLPFSGKMAAAQVGEWIKVTDTGPVDSMRASMVYDLAREKVVLFGGWSYAKGDDLGETWEWDGVQWTKVTTSGPSPRIDSQMMVYDTVREKVVLFGGTSYQGGWTTHNDMWEWDGAEWTRIMTDGPSPRQSPAMVFDSARGKIVLFGGLGASALGDTWEWDGAEWIQVAEEGPSPRAYHAMAYDSIRQRVVMYGGLPGGMYSGQKVLSDMWEWDGRQWTQVDLTGENPGFRAFHGMVFDDARGKTVLFSGVDRITGSGETIALNDSDIWEWDGNVWERISTPGPVSRASPAMIYDPIRREIVLFGGMVSGSQNEGVTANDTWVYSASSSGIPKSLWSLY